MIRMTVTAKETGYKIIHIVGLHLDEVPDLRKLMNGDSSGGGGGHFGREGTF